MTVKAISVHGLPAGLGNQLRLQMSRVSQSVLSFLVEILSRKNLWS